MESTDNWRAIGICKCRHLIKEDTARQARQNQAHWSSEVSRKIFSHVIS